MRGTRPVMGLLVAGSLAACGTTVPMGTGTAQQGPAGALDGGPAGGAQQGSTGTSITSPLTAATTSDRGAARGPAVGAPGSGSDTGTTGASSVTVPAGTAPGITASTINVGLWYLVNSKQAAAAYGATGAGAGGGDGKAIWDAVVDDINKHGGVLGRRLVPVYHVFDSTSPDSFSSIEEQACTDWTQDHKVFWVSYAPGKTLTPCLDKAGVAQGNAQPTDAATAFYRQHPYFIESGTFQIDRIAADLPTQLQQEGWFTKWDTVNGRPGGLKPVKVGVIAFSDPYTDNAVNHILVPLLNRITGVKTDVVSVTTPNSTGDNATAISSIQAATLKFSQDGVTHVLPFETQGAGIGVFFAQGAQNQDYHPRYGLTSGNAAQLYIDQNLFPKAQLHGALGMGWEPLLDLTNADNPDNGPYSNDARRQCVALMRAHQIDVSAAIVKRQALEACSTLHFFRDAMTRGGVPTRAGYRAGAEALGGSFASPLVFATRFDAAHHDGAAAIRPLAFLDACSCIRYTGSVRPIP